MIRQKWSELRLSRGNNPELTLGYSSAKIAFEIGAHVRLLREQRGWSQSDLGRRCAMSQPAIARFEAGGTIPTLAVLGRIAEAFETTLHIELRSNSAA